MRKRILLTPSCPPLSVSLLPSLLVFPPLSSSVCLPGSCHSLHTMDQNYYEGTDYLSPVPADGERTEEFEYEVRIANDIAANYSLTDLLAWLMILANLNLEPISLAWHKV